ncbi:MAG TPA: trypsin-like peptidase domain-containing protein [Acidimicrobiales bacterium]|nr:trypsin-like peptidase domain-containing protein [Acidimicrobiales bacterium]
MSERDNWPGEQEQAKPWAAPGSTPEAGQLGMRDQAGPASGAATNQDGTATAGAGPVWPSAPTYPGYGPAQAERTYPDRTFADPSYADPSYGGYGGQAGRPYSHSPYDQGSPFAQPPRGPGGAAGGYPGGGPAGGYPGGTYTQGAYGQASSGQAASGQATSGPGAHGQGAYGQSAYGPPYGAPPGYGNDYGQAHGPSPYGGYGPYPGAPGSTPPPGAMVRNRSRGLRAASAIVVIAAAAVAGGGVSQLIWSSSPSASSATPPTTATPSTTPSGSGGYNPFGGGSPAGTSPGNTGAGGTSTSEGSGGPSDVSAIASRVDPAVVDVNLIFNYQTEEGAGTGIVLTSNGLVLTNNHVIDEATKISVTDIGNGQTYGATVLGYDSTHDVALLQLQGASGLTAAKLSSLPASVGQAVVAIGNAGGIGGTPTSAGGSVTALDQSITASDELTQRSEDLTGLIEVNANIEAGDSGGPLVNTSGQVLGMDTAASEGFNFQTQGNQGFAIPISYAMSIAHDIEVGKGTSTVHVGATAFLGLLLDPNDDNGLVVSSTVAGTPARTAGIVSGDTLTSFDGKTLTSGDQLTQMLVQFHPGDKVKIGWLTALGQAQSATVVLASGPPA